MCFSKDDMYKIVPNKRWYMFKQSKLIDPIQTNKMLWFYSGMSKQHLSYSFRCILFQKSFVNLIWKLELNTFDSFTVYSLFKVFFKKKVLIQTKVDNKTVP